MTVNMFVPVELPPGVVTVMFRVLTGASAAIVIVIGKLVSVPFEPIVALIPDPLNDTLEAPSKFAPTIVADMVVP
jgi:hypothetical protein